MPNADDKCYKYCSWIVCQELRKKKFPLIQFIVPLAENLVYHGKSFAIVRRRREVYGLPSARFKKMTSRNVDHLPVEGKTRRRCAYCATKKIEKRSKTLCYTCKVPLCTGCFLLYHS